MKFAAAAPVSETADPAPPVLWVPASRGGIPPGTPVLGLPLARRIALGARRAGFSRIVFEDAAAAGSKESLLSDLAGTGAEVVPVGTPAPDPSVSHAVLLPPGLLPTSGWLRGRVRGETATSGTFLIRDAADVPRAERWLLRSLIKDEEGFMSRHFERRISLAISRRLAGTGVTPNMMTLVSVGVGLAGAAFFLFSYSKPSLQLAGALLFLLHSILDGCDGELARLNFQESRLGGVLDFWGDNVVHSAVFGCIAVGAYRATGELWPLAAGLAAIAGTLASAAFVYRRTMSRSLPPKTGPQFTSVTSAPPTRLSRAADALARRDFIYLVVALAAFGRAHWFLALAAVGAPLFFLVLVALDAVGRSEHRRPGRSLS